MWLKTFLTIGVQLAVRWFAYPCLVSIALVSSAHAVDANFLYWYDYGYASGELTMPPSGDQRITDWHRRWPGHADMFLTPSSCSREGQALIIGCSSTSCGGGFTCRAKYECPKGYSLISGTKQCKCSISGALVSSDGSCALPEKQSNNGKPKCGVGNPVNVLNGNKYQQEADDPGSGHEFSLRIVRSYNSNSSTIGIFGQNWTSVFDAKLYLNGDQSSAMVVLDDGVGKVFNLSAGQWVSQGDAEARLTRNNDETWSFLAADGISYLFDPGGQLLTKINEHGRLWIFEYENQVLKRVQDSYGTSFEFVFDMGRLIRIDTPYGSHEYTYERGNLTKYKYTSLPTESGSVTFVRQYLYDDPEFPQGLSGIINEEGIRYAVWDYDSQGRARSSSHAGETESVILNFEYENDSVDPRVTATNTLGKLTTYHYANYGGVRKIASIEGHASTNCAAANKSYDYYPNGTLKSKTDWSGNITTYERDEFGREVSRTEASGTPEARTVATEYHPTLNLPVRIVEPDRVEVMTYDANGHLLSKNIQPNTAPSP